MVFDNTFKYTATGKYYNVVYLITCQCCKLEYAGSSITFKERFRIHKSDINTGKKRCGAAKHFLGYCTSGGKYNLKITLISSS